MTDTQPAPFPIDVPDTDAAVMSADELVIARARLLHKANQEGVEGSALAIEMKSVPTEEAMLRRIAALEAEVARLRGARGVWMVYWQNWEMESGALPCDTEATAIREANRLLRAIRGYEGGDLTTIDALERAWTGDSLQDYVWLTIRRVDIADGD